MCLGDLLLILYRESHYLEVYKTERLGLALPGRSDQPDMSYPMIVAPIQADQRELVRIRSITSLHSTVTYMLTVSLGDRIVSRCHRKMW